MTPLYPLLAAMALAACNPVATLTPDPDCEVAKVVEVTDYSLDPGATWKTITYVVTMADGRRVVLTEEEGRAIQADPMNACDHLEEGSTLDPLPPPLPQ